MGSGVREPDELLLGFTRALRAAGVRVTQDRAMTFLRAVSAVGLGSDREVYWAGQATLCGGPEDLRLYDLVFAQWFYEKARESVPPVRPHVAIPQAPLPQANEAHGDGPDDQSTDVVRALASDVEVLRHRDIAGLSAEERSRLAGLFATLVPRSPRRAAFRREPWHRGELDPRATMRRTLRTHGEPLDLAWRRRRTRPRRVVLLLDVSGSMDPYADALLRLAHRFIHGLAKEAADGRRGTVEVFTLGTRITRVTRALGPANADQSLSAAGDAVPDWSGGTRLGETLKTFLDRWGQGGMARGSVVVIVSDGWERGDATVLGDQMARLRRLAHRVVWMNPHRGLAGYQPVQQGMATALPHVDDFVAGHSLATFADLMEVVADA